MIFKLYDCDIGITLKGVNYEFEHVDSITVEDPRRVRLTRGANASNKRGIEYDEGIKDASVITTTVIGLPMELHRALTEAFEKRERMDFYCISRVDGSSKLAKNAVLTQRPQQLTIDDTAESMNSTLAFESFDVVENHKS